MSKQINGSHPYSRERDIIYILKRKKEKDEITMITVGLELGEVPSALVSV